MLEASETSEIKSMPDLKLQVNEMATNKLQSDTDYTKKFDIKSINGFNCNEIKSDESINNIKTKLNEMLAEFETDSVNTDRSGSPLSFYQSRFKNFIANEKFVALYMQLPLKEQKAWMVEEYKNICPDLPENIVEMLPGALHPADYGEPLTEKPDWLDMEKFKKGQQFQQDNYIMSWLSVIYGFYTLFNIDDALRPIIMNNNSHTPYRSFRRYLSTMKRMDELFVGDPWTEGTPAYKEIQNIRKQHLGVRQKLCKYDNKTLYNACVIQNPYAPSYDIVRKDIESFCPVASPGQCPFNLWESTEPGKPKSMNQIGMALTQWCFLGFILTNPENLGISNATDENLEAFCHMWRGIGYLLGIRDEFNFCTGSLEEIKARARNINEYWIKPSFLFYSKEVEHASRSIYDGLNYYFMIMDYDVITLQLSEMLNIQMPNVYASMSYPSWFLYKGFNLLTRRLITISLFRKGINTLFLYLKKRALAFDSRKLAELQEKSKKSPLHVPLGQSIVT